MIHRKYSSKGIVIKRKNYSEADRLIILFTQDFGKVSFIAKGVRRPSSRKRGHIEIFSHINFSATRTKSIDILTEVETDKVFDYHDEMKRITVAYFMVETIDKLTHEGEKNDQLYLLLLRYLESLQSDSKLKHLRYKFIEEILILLGYHPKGKEMPNPDALLEEITEKRMNSARVGKKLL